jgi:rod shape-determining protein MreC
MLMDYRSHYFKQFSAHASAIASPLQYAVNWPVQFAQTAGRNFETQHQVLEENAKLRANQLLLQAKLQKLAALQNENNQLRALLQSSPHVGGRYSLAQLLAVDMDPSVQKMILNKGSLDHVYVGQPVLDAYGVMGQVIKVGPITSQVLLVTDTQSAIPVQDTRNGLRAVVAGMGNNGLLQLVNVPDSTDIAVGDVLVTSGIVDRFPPDYPVGVVKSIKRDPEYRFASITLQPSAHINSGKMVLLVWPNQQQVAQQQGTKQQETKQQEQTS